MTTAPLAGRMSYLPQLERNLPLDELRKEIDRLDEEIVRLIGERAEAARKIGGIKEARGLSAYSPERERTVYEKVSSRNKGPLPDSCIRAVYREIMAGALALEKRTTIACPGPPCAPGHMAAREKFGASVGYVLCPDVAGVFQTLSRGEADYGVVPMENGTSASLDILAADGRVTVISEAFLPRAEGAEDSGSAPEGSGPSEAPARFFVIGKQSTRPTGRDRALLILHVRDEAGALQGVLKPFVEREINLVRIESRVPGRRAGECSFFVELEGHAEDKPVRDALAEVERLANGMAVLGSYPAACSWGDNDEKTISGR